MDNSGSWKVRVHETPLLRVPEENTEDLKVVSNFSVFLFSEF